MKLLNLVLYSNSSPDHNEGYEIMQEILNRYYKTFEPNVHTIFFKYTHDLDLDYELKDNILHIKGVESLMPGVLEKTLKAFKIIKDYEYDYVIRSNISSIINFKILIEELQKNPISFYGGCNIMDLQWTGGGITDSTWYGTKFSSGTSIILTRAALNFIIDNEHLINKTIIDDLTIGILIREYKPDIIPQQLDSSFYKNTPCFFTNNGFDLQGLIDFVKKDKTILYRNRCYNCRKVDEVQMKLIVDILMENNI